MTENGWKLIIACFAGLLIADMIRTEYRDRTEAARTEQEHYDREFSIIKENYNSE